MSEGMATIIALIGIAYIGTASSIVAARIESRVFRAVILLLMITSIALIGGLTVRMLLNMH